MSESESAQVDPTNIIENMLGYCPECHKPGKRVEIGRDDWCYCEEHQVCWAVGNLFQDYRYNGESMEQIEARWKSNDTMLSEMTEVSPWKPKFVPPPPLKPRKSEPEPKRCPSCSEVLPNVEDIPF
jgi:hypothetical protein